MSDIFDSSDLTTKVSTSSPANCLTVWMVTTCSWPLGPTPTWRGRGYQMRITLPQFLPLSAPVGLRPNHRSVYLYDRCCACFKCWLQVHSVKLRPDCSPRCQAQTVQSQCTKLDMKVSSVRNQSNFGLSCYLECLTWKMRLKVILCEGRKLS